MKQLKLVTCDSQYMNKFNFHRNQESDFSKDGNNINSDVNTKYPKHYDVGLTNLEHTP